MRQIAFRPEHVVKRFRDVNSLKPVRGSVDYIWEKENALGWNHLKRVWPGSDVLGMYLSGSPVFRARTRGQACVADFWSLSFASFPSPTRGLACVAGFGPRNDF